jgi:hypothetical protein
MGIASLSRVIIALTAWALSASVPASHAAQQSIGCQTDTLMVPGATPNQGLGYSVDMEGGVLVSGAATFNVDRGTAYVFERGPSAWNLVAQLAPPDLHAGDEFGTAVSVDGDTIAVGACRADSAGPDSGCVYVFVRQGASWVQQAKLLSTDIAAGDNFGVSVASQGNTLVVGAPFDSDLGTQSGAAYVFHRTGSIWTQSAKLLPSDGAANHNFGIVDIDGPLIAVGAPGKPFQSVADSGGAYVFRESGGQWTEEARLAPLYAAAGLFGTSIHVSGESVAVGEPFSFGFAGTAYVFSHGISVWFMEAMLFPGDSSVDSWFGYSVSLDGDRMIAGSPYRLPRGAGYVFERSSSGWNQIDKIEVPDGWRLGFSSSIQGRTVALGDPGASVSAYGAGGVFTFSLLDASTVYCTAKVNSLGCTPTIAATGMASATAAHGFVVSCSDVRNRKPGLLMYGVSGRAAGPFQGGTLCVQSPVHRTTVVNSNGSASPAQDCTGVYVMDMNAFARGMLGGAPMLELSELGTTVNCQWWGRDPGFPAPFNSTLSDGLEYSVCQ